MSFLSYGLMIHGTTYHQGFAMTGFDLKQYSDNDLLRLYGALLNEFRSRELVRTANNPVADIAEGLFCRALKWQRAHKECKGQDALDIVGVRYEIKARRLSAHNPSRQLSAIRSLDTFDVLAGVLFNPDFSVLRAALVPVDVVKSRAKWVSHTNSWRFLLRDDVWDCAGVKDVTADLAAHHSG